MLISGSKIRNQNCSLKLLPRGEVPRHSSVRSRTFNTVRSADKQLLRRANSTQALRRIFEKLKDASELIGWEPEKFILFPDNFPIHLLKSFNRLFANGREFKFKSFTFWIRRRSQPAKLTVLFSELSLDYCSFLLTITKKETEQETNHSSSIESPRFLTFSFEELQKRSLLRRNSTEVDFRGLCDPLRYWEGFLMILWIFKRLRVFEAQGEFREESLTLIYALTLPINTFLAINNYW